MAVDSRAVGDVEDVVSADVGRDRSSSVVPLPLERDDAAHVLEPRDVLEQADRDLWQFVDVLLLTGGQLVAGLERVSMPGGSTTVPMEDSVPAT